MDPLVRAHLPAAVENAWDLERQSSEAVTTPMRDSRANARMRFIISWTWDAAFPFKKPNQPQTENPATQVTMPGHIAQAVLAKTLLFGKTPQANTHASHGKELTERKGKTF